MTSGQRYLYNRRREFIVQARNQRAWDDWQGKNIGDAYRAAARSLRPMTCRPSRSIR